MYLFKRPHKNDLKTNPKTTTQKGNLGEDAACDYLISKGWRIIKRNWRFSHLEIDIIAQNENYIAFVEVKTRKYVKDSPYGTAAQAVNKSKQQNIIKAAQAYLAWNPTHLQARLDIIEVYTDPASDKFKVVKLNHLENAYTRR